MTYFEAYKRVEAGFEKAGVPEPAIDARYLLEYVSDFTEAGYLLKRNEEMPETELAEYEALAERRMKREPLQYIIGSQEFMGLPFLCTGDCLIPRQDTEILVEHAMEAVKERRRTVPLEDIRVIDLCTGSGCVIVSLTKLCNLKNSEGTDISEAALAVAGRNATENGTDVKLYASDLFEKVAGRFDIITANPPYIDTGLIHGLIPEIWEYEPMVALDGGEDGLYFYRRIVDEAPDYLKDGGYLLFEIGDTQGKAVSALMLDRGFKDVKVYKDLAGLDRVVLGHI